MVIDPSRLMLPVAVLPASSTACRSGTEASAHTAAPVDASTQTQARSAETSTQREPTA